MKKLLRYNGRHHLYWQIKGPKGMQRPQLNPIQSSYGPHVRNISWHEPMWLFRLRQRFAAAGPTTCNGTAATWDWGPDGARTCSHCGSLHPDDFIDIMYRYAQRETGFSFSTTSKGYKLYGNRPGVVNAGQGGIKFYTYHLPKDDTEFMAAYQLAIIVYRDEMTKRWGPQGATL